MSDAPSGNDRIQKFTTTGTFITRWGSEGSGDGQFNGPVSVAVDNADNVYVTDQSNSRIQKFKLTTPCPTGRHKLILVFALLLNGVLLALEMDNSMLLMLLLTLQVMYMLLINRIIASKNLDRMALLLQIGVHRALRKGNSSFH